MVYNVRASGSAIRVTYLKVWWLFDSFTGN